MLAAQNIPDARDPPSNSPTSRSDKVESTATTKKQILKPASDIAVDLNASAAAETIQAERNTDASISSNAISVQDTAITETEIQVNLLTTPPTESTTGGTNVDATTSISSIAATAEIAGTEPNSEAANIPVIVAAVVNEASEPSQSLTVQDNNKDQVSVSNNVAVAEKPNHEEPRKEELKAQPPKEEEEVRAHPKEEVKKEPKAAAKEEDTLKIPEKGSEGRKRMVLMIVNRWSILWKLLRRRSWRHRPPRGLEMGEGLYLTPAAAVGHKGQLDESEKGLKWFCGTKAVIEYAMDHLPHLVAEVSRNVDYGQLEQKQEPAQPAPVTKEVSSKTADVATVDVKTTGKAAAPLETSKTNNKSPKKAVVTTHPRPSARHRRRPKIRFSVGDIVEVVRHHREDTERSASTATRTLRVRHDQWFNARIIKIYPDKQSRKRKHSEATTPDAATQPSRVIPKAKEPSQTLAPSRPKPVAAPTTTSSVPPTSPPPLPAPLSLSAPLPAVPMPPAVEDSAPTGVSTLPEHLVGWMRALSRDRLRQELRRRGLRATGAKAMLLKRLISYEVRCQVKHGKKKALDSDRPGVDPACDSLATMQEERELVPKDFYLKEGDFGFSAKITAALNAMDINSRVAMVKKSSNMLVKGNAAPKRSNLFHYLRTRPHMKIHIPSLLGKCTKRRSRSRSQSLNSTEGMDAETQRREERVKMFNPHTGTVLRGMAAPKRKNLEKYLIRYPDMKVYTTGESSRSKRRKRIGLRGDPQTPLLYDVKYEDSNIEFGVKEVRIRPSPLGKMVTWRGEQGRITASKNISTGVVYSVYFAHNGVTKAEVRAREVKLIASPVKAEAASEDDMHSDDEMDSNNEDNIVDDADNFGGVLKLPTGWKRVHRRRQRGDRAGQRYSVYFGPNGEVIHDSLTEVWRRSQLTKIMKSTTNQSPDKSTTKRNRSRSRNQRDRKRQHRDTGPGSRSSLHASSKSVSAEAKLKAGKQPLSSVTLFANFLHRRAREEQERRQPNRTRDTRSSAQVFNTIDMNAFRKYIRRRQLCRNRREYMREMILALLNRIGHASAMQKIEGKTPSSSTTLKSLASKTEIQLLRILVNQQATQDREDAHMDSKYEMYCDLTKDGNKPRTNPDSLLARTEASAEKFMFLRDSDEDFSEESQDSGGESQEDNQATRLLTNTKLVPLPTLEDMRTNNPGLVEQINPTLQSGSSSVCGGALAMVTLTREPTPIDRNIGMGKPSIKLSVSPAVAAKSKSEGLVTTQPSRRSRKRKRSISRKRRR